MNKKIWIILLIIVILVIFFFPKECEHSYEGFIQTGNVLNREECNCFGIKYGEYGNMFGLGVCMDCGKTEYCMGIPIGKTCYEWVADGTRDYSSERQIKCK